MPKPDFLRGGQVSDALKALESEVRKDPSASKHRVFLFHLLSVLGAWDRAAMQLGVAGDLDAKALPMVQTYRTAHNCEALRASVFTGERSPLVFGDPEEWIARLLEALRLTAAGRHAEAERMRESGLGAAPATPGHIDGQAFEWDCGRRQPHRPGL